MWESRPGTRPEVRTVWRAEATTAGSYTYPGSEYWGISFARAVDGTVSVELEGPSVQARSTTSVVGERYWGIELSPFVVLRGAPKQALLGDVVVLPTDGERVELGGERWLVPTFDELESWVEVLVRAGAMIVDADIAAALDGDRVGAVQRTWQRRYRRTVGLTSVQVLRIRRAEHAFALLQQGVSPADAAVQAGFSDQAHLTRNLRLIRGRTPAAILAAWRTRERR